MEIKITNYGAIIMSVIVPDASGKRNDIVLGFDRPEDYWAEEYLENYPYFGAAIGRYGNRIDKASFTIDSQEYLLNSKSPGFQLHGGVEGFDKKVWKRADAEDDKLVLEYISPDGEEGFPGELTVRIAFHLSDQNELSYTYTAQTTKATAVNLTHHSYFNLNNGEGSIHEHYLKVHADHYLEQDANFCTTGKVLDVAGTRNDFKEFRQTGTIDRADLGIDISFPLRKQGIDDVAAEAYSDRSDIKLEVYTTEPLVHLYNGYYNPAIKGKNGLSYTQFNGFCFETQVHPNAVNIPSFPNTILRPDEQYYSKTVYRFSSKS